MRAFAPPRTSAFERAGLSGPDAEHVTVCERARVTRGMTRERLASAACVSIDTVIDCECGYLVGSVASKRIRAALAYKGRGELYDIARM